MAEKKAVENGEFKLLRCHLFISIVKSFGPLLPTLVFAIRLLTPKQSITEDEISFLLLHPNNSSESAY